MADPVYVQCSSSCTVTLDVSAPLLDLTTDDAGQLALAMITVLGVGWAFRILVKTLGTAGGGSGGDESS